MTRGAKNVMSTGKRSKVKVVRKRKRGRAKIKLKIKGSADQVQNAVQQLAKGQLSEAASSGEA